MKRLRIFLAIAIAAVALSARATNPRIDKVIKDLEKSKNVELTFTEKRDPETHTVTYSSYLIKFANESKAKELMELFEKERENSIEASKSKQAYSLTFFADGVKSTYVLIPGAKTWTLSVNKQLSDATRSRRRSKDSSLNSCDPMEQYAETVASLDDRLSELGQLARLECLKELENYELNDLQHR